MKCLARNLLLGLCIAFAGVSQAQDNATQAKPAAGDSVGKKDKSSAGQDKAPESQRTLVDALDEKVPLELGVQLRIFRQARQRRSEIERMEGELDRRSARLKKLIDDVQVRYKTLRMIQDELVVTAFENQESQRKEQPEVDDAQAQKKKEEKVAKLAKVFDKMKAEDAAKMIPSMKLELVVAVIERVKPKQSAKILSKIDPEKAAKITGLLTGIESKKK